MAIHITTHNEHEAGHITTDHNPWDTLTILAHALATTITNHCDNQAPTMAKATANTLQVLVGIEANGGLDSGE